MQVHVHTHEEGVSVCLHRESEWKGYSDTAAPHTAPSVQRMVGYNSEHTVTVCAEPAFECYRIVVAVLQQPM